jgi:hypothetical protein
MDEQTTSPAFSGAIVLKAKTKAEVEALAAQLTWYAAFEDAFPNRYEGGFAIRGQVRAEPLDHTPDVAALLAQVRDQAVLIGQLQEQLAEAQSEHRHAAREAARQQKLLGLLTPEEHWRLIGRNVGEQGLIVVDPALGDEVLQALAREVLEVAAQRVLVEAPDDARCTQQAADVCAAIIRAQKGAPLTTTPEDAARQAERAIEITQRFRELFGGG